MTESHHHPKVVAALILVVEAGCRHRVDPNVLHISRQADLVRLVLSIAEFG